MALTATEAKRQAIDLLPASGNMSFEAWMDAAQDARLPREVLRDWPRWKDAGEIAVEVVQTSTGPVLSVRRGG